jgi:hypothetical protein
MTWLIVGGVWIVVVGLFLLVWSGLEFPEVELEQEGDDESDSPSPEVASPSCITYQHVSCH